MKEIAVNDKIIVSWDGHIATCKKCGKQIGVGRTKKDKIMPFDIDTHRSHFATCPFANDFRKKGG